MRIAIIGSGIAGLTAAHKLYAEHDIMVFEANDYVGGHSHTVDVDWHGRHYAIDTGFIVCNDWTYPNFMALLQELGIAYQRSNMSFSLSCERTGLEYNGTSLNTLFAQRRNLVNPAFIRMIMDILRFNSRSRRLLESTDEALTLGQYLEQAGYSCGFRDRYIVPMGMAIWSATESAVLSFPVRFFVDFFERHGFLNINNRPVWQAIQGGSREYVNKLCAPFRSAIRLSTPVAGIRRDTDAVRVRTVRGEVQSFDYIVLACHSDQALALLDDPASVETEILSAFPYQANEATLHTDTRMLPRNPRARAAWNYHSLGRFAERVALTYDMNTLQSLTASDVFMVTLNRSADIEPQKVIASFNYHHPVYLPAGVAAQRRRLEISGVRRTFYCGAYWRYGFHEDGVVSALWALDELARVMGVRAYTTHSDFALAL
ncbi:MAG: FAD-dependent oxidoreductase [Steroidobacteraceae bacterium]